MLWDGDARKEVRQDATKGKKEWVFTYKYSGTEKSLDFKVTLNFTFFFT